MARIFGKSKQTGKAKSGTTRFGWMKAGTAKGGKGKTVKAGTAKAGTAKTGTAKTGKGKSGTAKAGTAKAGRTKADEGKTGTAKSGGTKAGSGRAGATKSARTKTGTAKTGTAKAGTGRAGKAKAASSSKDRERAAAQREEASAQRHHHRPPAPVRALVILLAFAGMVAFAVVLSRLTLEPSAASESLTHTNLQPGDSLRDYLSQPAFRDTVKQLGGNIVLGVPFGVLLPVVVPQARGLVRVTLATAAVMLLVELVQGALITGRAFDVDDVILNSTGAFLGYLLLGRRLGRAVHPRRRHWWHRWTRPPGQPEHSGRT